MLRVVDADDLLKPGIYLLTWRGAVVFAGLAKCLLVMVAAHRAILAGRPDPILPRVQFDGFRVIACAEDRAKTLLPALIEFYRPRYNIHRVVQRSVIGASSVIETSGFSDTPDPDESVQRSVIVTESPDVTGFPPRSRR